MPYDVVKNHPKCPPDKPYGVVKEGQDMPMACHPMRAQAMAQAVDMMKSEQK